MLLVLWYITYPDSDTHSTLKTDLCTLCDHCSFLCYATEWVNCCIKQFTIYKRSTMSLFFKENTLAEVIYLLNIFNKIRFFLGNSNNADRNDVNEQNTYRETYHLTRLVRVKIVREVKRRDMKWVFHKQTLLNVTNEVIPLFKTNALFYQPTIFRGKLWEV